VFRTPVTTPRVDSFRHPISNRRPDLDRVAALRIWRANKSSPSICDASPQTFGANYSSDPSVRSRSDANRPVPPHAFPSTNHVLIPQVRSVRPAALVKKAEDLGTDVRTRAHAAVPQELVTWFGTSVPPSQRTKAVRGLPRLSTCHQPRPSPKRGRRHGTGTSGRGQRHGRSSRRWVKQSPSRRLKSRDLAALAVLMARWG
jgi:hypothetical protein